MLTSSYPVFLERQADEIKLYVRNDAFFSYRDKGIKQQGFFTNIGFLTNNSFQKRKVCNEKDIMRKNDVPR